MAAARWGHRGRTYARTHALYSRPCRGHRNHRRRRHRAARHGASVAAGAKIRSHRATCGRGRARFQQVSERFSRIREQAERAAALTRELLAFARRQVLQPQAVDINAITSGLVSFLDKVIARDIELKVITAAVDAVKADPTQLEQVLMNLCLNARDAMPKGGRLQIRTEMAELDDSYCRFYPHVKPGRYAVLSVSDTGMGMDSETRARIFEPFFTTKERGKGTGMGLATAYGIVKHHGGVLHVYSEPGQRRLFRVYLPALKR